MRAERPGGVLPQGADELPDCGSCARLRRIPSGRGVLSRMRIAVYDNGRKCIVSGMRFDELYSRLGAQPCFDLATVAQLVCEPRGTLRMQLYRWCKAGRLLPLRRGMYAWPEKYRRRPLNPAALANALHRPSYLSGLWALAFYGLIPEQVTEWTSVTTRAPRRFVNAVGVFDYRHIKPEAFFGYAEVRVMGEGVLLARPEKALLDFWYLSKGAWTADRMEAMRYQNTGLVKPRLLRRWTLRFRSKRLLEAVRVWETVAVEADGGVIVP